MKKTTLAARITTFIFAIALTTIATFTVLQLRNQLATISNQNIYQSRLNAIVIKNNFEEFIKKFSTSSEFTKGIQSIIQSLTQTNIVNTIQVISSNGLILGSSDTSEVNTHVSEKERIGINAIENVSKRNLEKWLYTQIDEKIRTINLYIPIHTENQDYIIKSIYPLGTIKTAFKKTYTLF